MNLTPEEKLELLDQLYIWKEICCDLESGWTQKDEDVFCTFLSLIESCPEQTGTSHEECFVRHIENHLAGIPGAIPTCTLCGKTILEIAEESYPEPMPKVDEKFILTESCNLNVWATDELSPNNENQYIENWAVKLRAILEKAGVSVEDTQTATEKKPRTDEERRGFVEKWLSMMPVATGYERNRSRSLLEKMIKEYDKLKENGTEVTNQELVEANDELRKMYDKAVSESLIYDNFIKAMLKEAGVRVEDMQTTTVNDAKRIRERREFVEKWVHEWIDLFMRKHGIHDIRKTIDKMLSEWDRRMFTKRGCSQKSEHEEGK